MIIEVQRLNALTPGAGRKSVGHIKDLSERRFVNKSPGFFYYIGIKLGELVHRCTYAANGAQPSVTSHRRIAIASQPSMTGH